MSIKLELELIPETDTKYEYLQIRQEGFSGFNLELSYLKEFIEALESDDKSSTFVPFIESYGFRHSKMISKFIKYTKDQPLLQLTSDQCAKMSLHLRSTYSAYL